MNPCLYPKTGPQRAGPAAWRPPVPRLTAGLLALGAAFATLGAAVAPAAVDPARQDATAGRPPAAVAAARHPGEPT
jgi:hypothetical protein